MLISEQKLGALLEVMTKEVGVCSVAKARRAIKSWAIQRGRVTFDTLGQLEHISDEDLLCLRRFVNIAVTERGLLDDQV